MKKLYYIYPNGYKRLKGKSNGHMFQIDETLELYNYDENGISDCVIHTYIVTELVEDDDEICVWLELL